ncbi:MAG: hypothetical protein ACJ8J0_13350 [Longimicrobiaceae bacterium]
MRPPLPAGFLFLTFCAFFCACLMAVALALPEVSLAERFAYGATGALALVVAEALAFVRPWAFGASIALAGTFIATLFVVTADLEVFLVFSVIAGLFIVIALAFVYEGMNPAPAVPGTRRRYPRAP